MAIRRLLCRAVTTPRMIAEPRTFIPSFRGLLSFHPENNNPRKIGGGPQVGLLLTVFPSIIILLQVANVIANFVPLKIDLFA